MLKNRDTIFIPSLKLTTHEFHTTIRSVVSIGHMSKIEILKNLYEKRQEVKESLSKSFGLVIIIYFAFSSGQDAISISNPYLSISIPRVIALFSLSLFWFNGFASLISYTILTNHINSVLTDLYPNANWPTLSSILDTGEGAWIEPALSKHRFFKSGLLNRIISALSMMVILVPFLLIGSIIIIESGSYLLQLILSDTETLKSRLLGLVTIILISFPVIYIFLISIPLPLSKNRSFVRWNFLTQIWRREFNSHPTSRKWLETEGLLKPQPNEINK